MSGVIRRGRSEGSLGPPRPVAVTLPTRYPSLRAARERRFTMRMRSPMANIASQVKRNRQNETARQRNMIVRSRTRTFVRRFRSAIAEGDAATAETAYAEAARELDRAAQKGVIHRNQAANRKSGMAAALKALRG